MSTTQKNLKVPYPNEGVIRSAQINDTICPENSVQLAVNMNFDRVGAMQTRPGVDTYATQLTKINNFGTLNNSIEPNGYNLLAASDINSFTSANIKNVSSLKIDTTHILNVWSGPTGNGYAQISSVNTTTNVTTPIGSPLLFDNSGNNNYNSPTIIDATHFVNFWIGTAFGGYSQAFLIDGSFNITAIGSPLNTDALGAFNSSSKIDATHYLNIWMDGTNTGVAQVFNVDGTTFAVTSIGSKYSFTSVGAGMNYPSSGQVDANHFITFSSEGSVGITRIFEVNLSTFAVTSVGTPFTYSVSEGKYNTCSKVDATHYINFWRGPSGDGETAVFTINLGTWAITQSAAALVFAPICLNNTCAPAGDGQHFTDFWLAGAPYTAGYGALFEVNLSTFVVTKLGADQSFGPTNANNFYESAVLISPYNIILSYNNNSNTGSSQFFKLQGNKLYQDLLYAQDNFTTVKVWDGAAWTIVRSGLSATGKARFAQYLNYIWMVNGNSTLGNPVMTSNGGVFGTFLVPNGFPQGDFIQAGFEGRVWIVDANADVVYYTDIVQFVPPTKYTLTFDVNVNFLKNFASQDGQKMTGLIQVPRALLLFKEDSIYRIYGAASVDAYPAYNVGTYSNESIVRAKDGLYFHHSSGFYKFDYGGQPIEISRRIIDFVKAIPRDSYEDISGVWDGFDNIKWSIGPVTVEGVTYANCQVRYTISTQVWTIYDYVGNTITAMIRFDNGTDIKQIMGTLTGVVGQLDYGTTDFGKAIYYEMIDRWRCFNDMYSYSKAISGLMLSSENGAGTVLEYQTEKSQPNVYEYIDMVKDKYDALFPNASTNDFNNLRFRFRGNTLGTPLIFHAIEILSLQIKGLDEN